MLLWQVKISGAYTDMKTPSTYKIDWEDLDNNSYRSITSGNLIDTVVSKSWTKLQFNYNCLTESELQTILPILANNPLYVKAKNPIFGTEYVEMEMRCSKKSAEMLETGDYTLSFNLVQKKKVSGQ
ncbi:MAG TPA: hypothetical protein GX692_02750 [Acholeplasmataceae bacterium]|jgi:hypothetical protein|nr:hypothetical protein [Acholeplasmataceae bacterium]